MKVAIYAICKNEEKHIERFLDTCGDADGVFVLDTGSTDKSVQLLKNSYVNLSQGVIEPWRFDAARNKILQSLPTDFDLCLSLDFDEYLSDGWYEKLDEVWRFGITRIEHWYSEIGKPKHIHHKCHSRYGYHWKNIVHEELSPEIKENVAFCDFDVIHTPDLEKDRDYNILLEQHLRECPNDERAMIWLAIDYFNKKCYDVVIRTLEPILLNEKAWCVNKSYACSLIAEAQRLDDYGNFEIYHTLVDGLMHDPDHRDPWLRLARFYLSNSEYLLALNMVNHALKIKERVWANIADEGSWNGELFRIGLISSARLGRFDEATRFYTDGVRNNPEDQEIAKIYGDLLSRKNP